MKPFILFLNIIEFICYVAGLIPPFYLFPPPTKRCFCGISNENRTRDYEFLKIIGGTVADYHEFPWLVQLQYRNRTVCGGAIISDLFVLTAAHCYRNDFVQTDLKIAVAQHDMCSNNNEVNLLSVNRVVQHEDFDIRTYYADIMLLKLSMRLGFNKFIRPICLPRSRLDLQGVYYGRRGLIAGWGIYEDESLALSCEPRKVYVPISSKNQCNATGSVSSIFCAGYIEGGSGFCDGDSGGAFHLKNDYGQYEFVGIISNSVGCGQPGQPGQYTDVGLFLPWIFKRIYGSRFC
ncbi:Trypsin [Popillia japonica]|uniref:Trypsin n=1 Tax=Popillia japonica TaxID=7064 RepID=A0AAW1JJL4_POPJA